MTNNITLTEIGQKLLRAEKILILTHDRADGDTIGSAYAVVRAFPEKQVFAVNDRPLPSRLAFLSGGERDLSLARLPRDFTPDLVLAVDTATLTLAGESGKAFADQIDLSIDHHPCREPYATFHYTDDRSASCCEVIFDILAPLGKINRETALPLYGGICSDTGCFRYSSVTPETYRKLAVLVETGIPFTEIAAQMISIKTQAEVRAIQAAYRSLTYEQNGEIAVVVITAEIKKELRLNDDDLSVLNSLPKDIAGVKLSIVIRQSDDDAEKYKVSLRTDEEIASDKICAKLGGGGHRCAAAASFTAESPEKARETVLNAVFSALSSGEAYQ